MQTFNIQNIGNILYLDDAVSIYPKQYFYVINGYDSLSYDIGTYDSALAYSNSITAISTIVSVDSRFSINAAGSTAYTNYTIQVTNCNPYLINNPYNQNLLLPFERIIVNPDFNNSWCYIGNLDNNGIFKSAAFYRFARITNIKTIEPNFKAYFYTEKQQPILT